MLGNLLPSKPPSLKETSFFWQVAVFAKAPLCRPYW